ncbi:hypothetical protein MRA01_63760 [Methylobacterium radiotolerans]|nr:hypothetical protein MRA01_63760 [Methylobacterium radiotolerans]
MRVRHGQLHPVQAAASVLAEKVRLERLGFGNTAIYAEHIATAVAVDAYRYDHDDAGFSSAVSDIKAIFDTPANQDVLDRTKI